MIEGSNMAENHPVGFQWVMKAKERGAKIIHIDPRFTRASAVADIHATLRPGTDIVFLGGLIHYILENDRYFHEYVLEYSNAALVISVLGTMGAICIRFAIHYAGNSSAMNPRATFHQQRQGQGAFEVTGNPLLPVPATCAPSRRNRLRIRLITCRDRNRMD